jgi:small GTP-binding protein
MRIKIVLLGDMNVGKTSFIIKYITGKFKQDNNSTLGASFFSHKIEIDDEEHMLEIWDTAGQERYRSLAPMYFRNSDIALLFFDLSNLNTYFSIDYWKTELIRYGPRNLIQIIVGNKLDLIDLEKLNSKYKKHFLISTKENIDLDKLIKISVTEAIKIKKNKEKENEIENEKLEINKKKKSTCC